MGASMMAMLSNSVNADYADEQRMAQIQRDQSLLLAACLRSIRRSSASSASKKGARSVATQTSQTERVPSQP